MSVLVTPTYSLASPVAHSLRVFIYRTFIQISWMPLEELGEESRDQ
jgi:hypothetical protein